MRASEVIARLGSVCTISREQKHLAPAHSGGERPERFGRRVHDDEMDAPLDRLCDSRRHLRRGFDGDALEREIDLEHARERLCLIEADLSARKG
jgi:hypothetical protein